MGGVVAISMVKDEADIIGQTVRLMLDEVERVLIADNGSTDGTRDILEDIARDTGRVEIRDDKVPGYFQSHKMSVLAADAHHQLGATWVIPFDADERWYSPFGRISNVLAEASHASVATAELYDHVATSADPAGDPITRMSYRRWTAAALPKVACRPYPRVTIHQGNHDASYGDRVDGLLVVRHFPYRSVEQFVSKVRNGAAAYAATDLPESQGQHWRDYGRLLEAHGEDAIADVFRTWFHVADPANDKGLIYDPCPV